METFINTAYTSPPIRPQFQEVLLKEAGPSNPSHYFDRTCLLKLASHLNGLEHLSHPFTVFREPLPIKVDNENPDRITIAFRLVSRATSLLLRRRVPNIRSEAVGPLNMDSEGGIVLLAVMDLLTGKLPEPRGNNHEDEMQHTQENKDIRRIRERANAIMQFLLFHERNIQGDVVTPADSPRYLAEEDPNQLNRAFQTLAEISGDDLIEDLAIAAAIEIALLENVPSSDSKQEQDPTITDLDQHLRWHTARITFPIISYVGFHTELAEILANSYYERFYPGMIDIANTMLGGVISPGIKKVIQRKVLQLNSPHKQLRYIIRRMISPDVNKVLKRSLPPQLETYRWRPKSPAQSVLKAIGETSSTGTRRVLPDLPTSLELLRNFFTFLTKENPNLGTYIGPDPLKFADADIDGINLRDSVRADIKHFLKQSTETGRPIFFDPEASYAEDWGDILDRYILDYAGIMYTAPDEILHELLKNKDRLREFLLNIYLQSEGRFIPIFVNSDYVERKQTPYSPPFINIKVFDMRYLIFTEIRMWSESLLPYEATTHRAYKIKSASKGVLNRPPIEFFADPIVQFGVLVSSGYRPRIALSEIERIQNEAFRRVSEFRARPGERYNFPDNSIPAEIRKFILTYQERNISKGQRDPNYPRYNHNRAEELLKQQLPKVSKAITDNPDLFVFGEKDLPNLPEIFHTVAEQYFKAWREIAHMNGKSADIHEPPERVLDYIIFETIKNYYAQKLLHDLVPGKMRVTVDFKQRLSKLEIAEATKAQLVGEVSQIIYLGFDIADFMIKLIEIGTPLDTIQTILNQCRIIHDRKAEPNASNPQQLMADFRRRYGTVMYLLKSELDPQKVISNLDSIHGRLSPA